MTKILIIAATGKEIEPFLKKMKVNEPELFDTEDFKYKKLKLRN